MKMPNSIRWKINIFQILLLLCVVIPLLFTHYHLTKKKLFDAKDSELQNLLLLTIPIVSPAPHGVRQGAHPGFRPDQKPDRELSPFYDTDPETELLDDIQKNNLYVTAWDNNDLELTQYGKVPSSLKFNTYKKIPKQNIFETRDGNRELIVFHKERCLIVLGTSLTETYKQLAVISRNLILIGISIILVGIIIGWFVSGEIVRPIKKISQTAKEITSGERHKRIKLSDAPAELTTLASALNQSFDYFEDVIKAQARFSADASHELRTPISIVIAQTQTALKKERTVEEYQTFLNACLRAGKRMKSMANSLLDLQQSETINKSMCNLNEVINNTYDIIKDLSDKHPISFECTKEPIIINVDEERIKQVIMNLVSNAVQHNPDGCNININLAKKQNSAVIEVADDGVGIPEDALPNIFDRFYRVDKSRSREHGGAGLGLSIVKTIIESHGGTINVLSYLSSGTTFVITLNNSAENPC